MNIKVIPIEKVTELRVYKQSIPSSNYITIIRGFRFYARCDGDNLQEWTTNDNDIVNRLFNDAVAYEEKLGSELQ